MPDQETAFPKIVRIKRRWLRSPCCPAPAYPRMLRDFTVLILDSVFSAGCGWLGHYYIRQSLSAFGRDFCPPVYLNLWRSAGLLSVRETLRPKRVLPAILAEPRSLLAGIVTRTPAKANPFGVPAWTSLEVALAEQACEAVYVASPVVLHAPQTIASLRAGRHVLCEKPMAMNYEEALSMQQTADKVGRILGIAYYRRMYPHVNRARELIRLNAIGEPVFAEATSHSKPSASNSPWMRGTPHVGFSLFMRRIQSIRVWG